MKGLGTGDYPWVMHIGTTGYFSWGWLLWFGIIFLFVSSIGNWGYTYQAHSRYGRLGCKPALDILDERYAKGDISREEYGRLKMEIAGA